MIRREDVADRLALDGELATKVLTSFIADAVETTGTEGVVVGLSGGVDSALSTALAARALGPGRVHSFSMPYRTSNPDSAADAERVNAALGLSGHTVDISAMVDGYYETNEPEADRVRRGNLMARLECKSGQWRTGMILPRFTAPS